MKWRKPKKKTDWEKLKDVKLSPIKTDGGFKTYEIIILILSTIYVIELLRG